MNKNLEDFAKDLAIEIEVGGDRFDRLDFAYILYASGLKPEGVEDFRKKVSSFIHRENCSEDFLKKQLDYWLPDWICELGEFEAKRIDNDLYCDVVTRLSSEVFACYFSEGPDYGFQEFFGKDAVPLHTGEIFTISDKNKYGKPAMKSGIFVFDDTEAYAFTKEIGEANGEKIGIIKVDLKTAEVEKHVFTPASDISIDYIQKSGLCTEVLRSAFDYMSELPFSDGNDALRAGMREWDIAPEKSLKI